MGSTFFVLEGYGVLEGVNVLVGELTKPVGVLVGVGVNVAVELLLVVVGVLVGVSVSVSVGVFVGVSVGVAVGPVGVMVGVSVDVSVAVFVGVFVGVAVGPVDVIVGVAVGDSQKVETVAGAAPPPEVSNSNVPNKPEVWMERDWPAFNWKVLLATGVPFSNNVQMPAPVILLPVLVIVSIPCASGVQFAESEIVGASVGVSVGVAVGDSQKVETVAGAAPPPDVSSSSVPNKPEVWMERDWPAFNWKVLLATGVPFSSKVQVPWLVISLPRFVIVNVPCASGVQLAEREITGVVAWAAAGPCPIALRARTRTKNNAINE